MIKEAENLKSTLHLIIDKVSKLVANILKAIVTLLCLGASVSYSAGVKVRETFDNYNADVPDANIDTVQETSKPIKYDELVVEQVLAQGQQVEDVLVATVTTADHIIDIIQSINIVRPIIKPNSQNAFIAAGLADTLANTFVEATTYKLPKNKRVKNKTHVRHKDLGVLKQYYPVLVATGTLS